MKERCHIAASLNDILIDTITSHHITAFLCVVWSIFGLITAPPNSNCPSDTAGLAFCYDVFFVFISPYVFGSSVMVTVATGSTSTTHTDENYCEKYPTDSDCALNSLPMLLVVPTLSSYLSSESLLGLGDIVLPGLLLVWAAR
jgi:signal peptide peptidase-like 2B